MTTETFLFKVQDYYSAKYTATQAEEVTRWCEKQKPPALKLVWRYIVETGETQYKRLPDIALLNKIKTEVYEAYPELRAHSYNQQLKHDSLQITEGEMPQGAKLLQTVVQCINAGHDPRSNPDVIKIMREAGYTDYGTAAHSDI
jgi:hypothetical protein